MLSTKAIDEYVTGGGTTCPFCRNRHLESERPENIPPNRIKQQVHCYACGKTYIETYRLVTIEEQA